MEEALLRHLEALFIQKIGKTVQLPFLFIPIDPPKELSYGIFCQTIIVHYAS